MPDPGFVADILAGDNEAAKALLRRLGLVEMSEVCEHDWHDFGEEVACQKCGTKRD